MKKKINKIKQKSSKHKIITNTWIEHSNGISTHGNTRQSVPSGKSFYKKRILVRVNGRWVTLELECWLEQFNDLYIVPSFGRDNGYLSFKCTCTWETGNSEWRIKWFVPFCLRRFRTYGLRFKWSAILYFF